MAITNFISTVWSARIQQNLRNKLVFAQPAVTNRNYEGEIRQQGDTVKILSFGEITVNDYVRNQDMAAPQQLDDASAVLTVDQAKSFFFAVDDVDTAQAAQGGRLIDLASNEASFQLRNTVDGYLAGFHVQAGQTIGSDASPWQLGLGSGDKNMYETIVDIGRLLDEANCPEEGRWCIMPPWAYALLLKDSRFVQGGTPMNRATIANGLVGEISGISLMRSNQVKTVGANYKIMAGHPDAWTFAEQIIRTEAVRLERRFSDAVKGLQVYGAKITRPSITLTLTASKGTI